MNLWIKKERLFQGNLGLAAFKMQIVKCKSINANGQLQILKCKMQIAKCKLQIGKWVDSTVSRVDSTGSRIGTLPRVEFSTPPCVSRPRTRVYYTRSRAYHVNGVNQFVTDSVTFCNYCNRAVTRQFWSLGGYSIHPISIYLYRLENFRKNRQEDYSTKILICQYPIFLALRRLECWISIS